jgi:hypothetical protein
VLVHDISIALRISVAATGFALLCFGTIKGHFTGVNKIKAAAQTLLVGRARSGCGLLARPFVWVEASLTAALHSLAIFSDLDGMNPA